MKASFGRISGLCFKKLNVTTSIHKILINRVVRKVRKYIKISHRIKVGNHFHRVRDSMYSCIFIVHMDKFSFHEKLEDMFHSLIFFPTFI